MELTQKTVRSALAGILTAVTLTLNVGCDTSSSTTTDSVSTESSSTTGLNEEGSIITDGSNGSSQPTAGSYSNAIQTMAASSSCASYSFAGRGRAPAAYIKGMALTFAKSYCRLKTSPSNIINILSGAAGSSTTDALGLFSSNFSAAGMDVNSAGESALRSLYTLGVGLGMRESSGKYCEGRDMSASNTSASTAEAGMFQTSYDSMGANSELRNLFDEYRNDPSKCFLDVYKVGVSCGSSSISGSGIGAEYQIFNKSCPAFAAEYAMLMLRVRRNHYGPINRKEAEVVPVCNSMLKNVQDFIDSDLNACSDVL